MKYTRSGQILFVFLMTLSISCKGIGNKDNDRTVFSESVVNHATERKPDSLDLKINSLLVEHNVSGATVAFIENGKLHSTKGYGILRNGKPEKVNAETMFSVGSISKVVSAILALKLVKSGKLDLDTNVNKYLTDWKVKPNEVSKNTTVTLRQILSHTAGFSIHGFDDFYPSEKLPSTIQILKGESPAKNEQIELVFTPGTEYKYSGGGYTVLQKIIEDVTGLSYYEAAEQILFAPLGLQRMTFENPLPETYGNIAKAHDENGNPVAEPIGYQAMPETAASGLWTSVNDLTKLLIKLFESEKDEVSEFLTPELINGMVTRQKNSYHGLGPWVSLYKNCKVVEHRGDNDSYRAVFLLFWNERKGYVVMTNGSNGRKLIENLIPVLDTTLNMEKIK